MEEIENIGKAFDVFKAQADEILKLLREQKEREENKNKKPLKLEIIIPYEELLLDIPDDESFNLTDSIRCLIHDGGTDEAKHNSINIKITDRGDW